VLIVTRHSTCYSDEYAKQETLCRCRIEFAVKKEGWGGGGTRILNFSHGQGDTPTLKPSGKALAVSIGVGLPKESSKLLCGLSFSCEVGFVKSVEDGSPTWRPPACSKNKTTVASVFA